MPGQGNYSNSSRSSSRSSSKAVPASMSLDIQFSTSAGTGGARLDPGLHLELASNNPFRNRAAAASLTPPSAHFSPSNPFFATEPAGPDDNADYFAPIRPRPVSRNPFLDPAATVDAPAASQRQPRSPAATMEGNLVDWAANDLKHMNLNGNSQGNVENLPPPSRNGGRRDGPLPVGHRLTRSQEDEWRPHPNGTMPSPVRPARPQRVPTEDYSDTRRPPPARSLRRNSESSVIDVRSGNSGEAEKRQQERRQRDSRTTQDSRGGSRVKPKKSNHRLDIIDKLDVTSIYGTGLFHHDGPFDACNPHRNRKGSRRAPMQAFAKDSPNNVLGGSGPLNKDINHAQYFGGGAEAFTDYSKSGQDAGANGYVSRPSAIRGQSFDPVLRVDPVHGDESLGLGTSTFLEGAPASRTAMQRRESESEARNNGSGMKRKQSLVKKIRGLNSVRHGRSGSIDMRPVTAGASPSPRTPRDPFGPLTPPSAPHNGTMENPFFSEYDAPYDRKGEQIANAERRMSGRARAPSSPRHGPAQSITNDTAVRDDDGAEAPKPSGFLSRVKSLKGGRRPRTSDRRY